MSLEKKVNQISSHRFHSLCIYTAISIFDKCIAFFFSWN